jgi:ATP-dependent DNA helicase RecG
MPLTTDALLKILDLEAQKGFADSSVMGGLDRLLENWYAQVQASIRDPKLLKALSELISPGQKYSASNKVQRRDWTSRFLKWLEEWQNPPPLPRVQPAPAKPALAARQPAKKATDAKTLELPVATVKGISTALSAKFAKLGVNTVRDLLYFFPNRHIDYSQRTVVSKLKLGEENTVVVNVWESREVQLGTRRSAQAIVGDETGNIRIVWFNQPFMAKNLKTGQRIIVSGRVSRFNDMIQFESPEWEPFEEKDLVHTGRWVPIYPLTQGLSQRQVRRLLKPAVESYSWQLSDFLPGKLRARLKFLELPEALRQAHYPQDARLKDEARRRLAFDELFVLQLGVMHKKRAWQESQPGLPLNIAAPELATFLASLPYQLTAGQKKALGEILSDLQKAKPMSRLLQGEVGSGKTVVATAALLVAVASGFQGALMAPTEILAEQHYHTFRRVLAGVGNESSEDGVLIYSGFFHRPLNVALLLGDLSRSKKRAVQARVSEGKIDIVIGTHALIQKEISFPRLGLAVIDEQHRFGVEQRSALRQKGANPHILVMTATPIPRTLALTLYGDMDLSLIDQVPPGRPPTQTKWLRPDQRASAYRFIHQQVKTGRQAFIICPLVEESESVQARAAVEEFQQLSREVFPDLRLGLLHGRLTAADKDDIMQRFHRGEIDVLVSTPVVEVGIDVPNATVMLIESADRFGLSQLHQFRGRIGRGSEKSYCMLLAENPSEEARERLSLIERTQSGFLLAEEDLKLRGPGEFFGTRQSGLPDLKMARLSDVGILELARQEAAKLFQLDPDLRQPENLALAREMERVWKDASPDWS